MAFCPPVGSSEFKELEGIFGERLAYLLWHKNGGHPLELDSDGSPSKLFEDIKANPMVKTREQALRVKARSFFIKKEGKSTPSNLLVNITTKPVNKVETTTKKEKISNSDIKNTLNSLEKLDFKFNFAKPSELVNSKNPLESKNKQNEIKRENAELQSLIKCLGL